MLNGPRTCPNTFSTSSTTAWYSAGTSDFPVMGATLGMTAGSSRFGDLFLGSHVISEDADVADLDFDDVARDHVPVGPLRTHPEHVAGIEGRVPAQLLDPGGRIPDLVGRREILPDRPVVADDDAERGGIQSGDDEGPERLEGVAILAAKHR